MKTIKILFTAVIISCFSTSASAWGKEGHAIVAEVAFKYMDKQTKEIVTKYLDGMTFQDAANWMDVIKDDRSMDYMKPYHYVNFEKGEEVKHLHGGNLLDELQKSMNELKNYKSMSDADVRQKIKMIFHLVGDLHQPMHVGYGTDKGGNTVQINFEGKGSNLHRFFDSGIIRKQNITTKKVLKENKTCKSNRKKIANSSVIDWANQSRSELESIYDFKGAKISQDYVNKFEPLVTKQLYDAGVRLAAIMNSTFK
ncbi:S1/P1 nuclease [Flavobacterium ardleyense]|uniref:S1/P1 nuclease n=1 Tax=Flavobacterium ardleyense TaxID=2038737 RepID=UPI00298C97EA|nr:S1/P1 nuclease [Flavobacterium ardleyense]